MTYVLNGYAITFSLIIAYTFFIILKGRALNNKVEPSKRRFLD